MKKEKKSEREKGTPKAGASGGEEAGAGRGRSRSVSVNISSPANSAARAEEERRQQERRRTRSVSVAGKNPQTPKTPQVMERDTDIINMDSLSLDANTDDSDAQMAALAADGVDTHKLTSRPPPPIKFNLASALKVKPLWRARPAGVGCCVCVALVCLFCSHRIGLLHLGHCYPHTKSPSSFLPARTVAGRRDPRGHIDKQISR